MDTTLTMDLLTREGSWRRFLRESLHQHNLGEQIVLDGMKLVVPKSITVDGLINSIGTRRILTCSGAVHNALRNRGIRDSRKRKGGFQTVDLKIRCSPFSFFDGMLFLAFSIFHKIPSPIIHGDKVRSPFPNCSDDLVSIEFPTPNMVRIG